MARPLRIEYPGALYHITSRGNARQKIFLDDKDYYLFLKCLDLTSKRYSFLVYSFCLMPNHYHLLLETPEGNLSKIMRQLNGVYTQKFNKKYGRVGHIFQGRYKAILVEKERYLLELIRYINLNPVRANLVKDPLDWKWSSLPYILNIKKKLPFLSEDFILMQFSEEKFKATKLFKEFIYAGIKSQSPFKNLKGQIFLGGDDFINKIKKHIIKKEELKEIPKVQRYAERPALEKILREEKTSLRERIFDAHINFGYTQKEIADFLGYHYSYISKIIKEIEKSRFKT